VENNKQQKVNHQSFLSITKIDFFLVESDNEEEEEEQQQQPVIEIKEVSQGLFRIFFSNLFK
jgi:hypothetical protein